MISAVPGTKILSLLRSLNEDRWSFTRGSNYRALPGNVSVLLIHTGCWSLTRGGRRWRLDSIIFLSVYDISQITFDVEIGFSDVIFSGLLVAGVCLILV